MPALANPRHEAVAQAIIAQMAAPWGERSNGRAYVAAGYQASGVGETGGAAEAAASRLLKNAKGILARVAELQEQARRRTKTTVQDITNRLDVASQIAEEDRLPTAIVAAETAKARVLGLEINRVEIGRAGDFSQATSSRDLAARLLLRASQGRLTSNDAIDQQAADAALRELSRHARAMAEIVDALCSRRALPVSTVETTG